MRTKYRKANNVDHVARQIAERSAPLLGMLYLVDVRLRVRQTGEIIKHRLLLVGCEEADIERKMRWLFDSTKYSELSIKGTEKVREKVHYLSTTIEQDDPVPKKVIDRGDHQDVVLQNRTTIEPYDPHLYAVGLSTTMIGKDEKHALRKVARALLATATDGESHSAAALSDDSTLTIEQIPFSSGYAKPRDTSDEVNKAHIMRG